MNKRTKIVCTIGPACEKKSIITRMVKAGMNVARLNFSHGTHKNHKKLIENIRFVAKKTGEPIAIIQDLQGPKIRLGVLPEEGIEIKKGEEVIFDTSKKEYKNKIVPITYDELHRHLKKGERILLADGKIEVKITEVIKTKIKTKVVVGGIISSHKGLNVPDSKLRISALTEKDKEDALFGVENNVDYIALSFVTDAKDIIDLRFLIKEYEKKLKIKKEAPIRIIAKIERHEAVDNIEEIMDVIDGIMIARGDLGMEIPAEQVPLVQKRLVDLALKYSKPVIVATQMLDSMQNNPRPTRAEVSDVANAVIDHTDAVMLSNETATGKYPIHTVKMMATIISETEDSNYDRLHLHMSSTKKHGDTDDIITKLSRVIAEDTESKLILAASISGDTGRLISKYRPELPIAVGTSSERVRSQLNLSWGIIPFILLHCDSIEELVERSVSYLKKNKIVKKKDKIVVVAGEPVGQAGNINLLELKEIK